MDMTRQLTNDIRRSGRLLAVTIVSALVPLGLVTAASLSLDIPIERALSDPLAELEAHPLLGVVSNLGALLWAGAAGTCLVAVMVLRRSSGAAQLDLRGFFLASGALTTVLMLDDMFQIHEDLVPRLFGHGQTFVLLGYVVLVVGYVWRFRRWIFASNWVILATAGCFFAVSLAVDVLPVAAGLLPRGVTSGVDLSRYELLKHLIEDGSKFIGIALWFAFFASTSANALAPGKILQKDPTPTPQQPSSPGEDAGNEASAR